MESERSHQGWRPGRRCRQCCRRRLCRQHACIAPLQASELFYSLVTAEHQPGRKKRCTARTSFGARFSSARLPAFVRGLMSFVCGCSDITPPSPPLLKPAQGVKSLLRILRVASALPRRETIPFTADKWRPDLMRPETGARWRRQRRLLGAAGITSQAAFSLPSSFIPQAAHTAVAATCHV